MVGLRLIRGLRILQRTIQADPELLCASIRRSIQIGQRDDAHDSRKDSVVVVWWIVCGGSER